MTSPTSAASPTSAGSSGRRQRVLGLGGAAVAAAMAVLWTVVVPDKAASTAGVQEWLIRWGHPASWALLTAVGVATAAGAPKGVRDLLAWAALASYGAFLGALAL